MLGAARVERRRLGGMVVQSGIWQIIARRHRTTRKCKLTPHNGWIQRKSQGAVGIFPRRRGESLMGETSREPYHSGRSESTCHIRAFFTTGRNAQIGGQWLDVGVYSGELPPGGESRRMTILLRISQLINSFR